MEMLINIIAGIIGGNLGGFLSKLRNLGPLLNTILGAVGGFGGSQLLGGQLTELMGSSGQVGGAVGGGLIGMLLPIIGGFFKPKN